jgi:hypothetical protein
MLVLYLHDEPNTLVVFAASCPICSSLILQQVLIRKQLLLSSMLQLASLMELYFEHASVCAGGCVAYQHMTCNSAAGGAVFPLMSLLCSSLTFCTHGHRHEFQPPAVPLTDDSNLQSFHRVTLQRLSRSVR